MALRKSVLILLFCCAAAQAGDKSSTRTIRYSYTVKNTLNTVAQNAEFITYLPVELAPHQKKQNVEINYPFTAENDAAGNTVVTCKLGAMPPYSQKVVRIKAEYRVSEKENKVPARKAELKKYLSPGRSIESDNAAIRELATRLTAKKEPATLKNLYTWISDNIEYAGYIKNNRGALYALENKRGDCTEYACLFAALSRAAGIPARVAGGYVCPENTVLQPSDYHNWVEVYSGGRWRVVDPQKGKFMAGTKDYIAMNYSSENERFSRFLCSGDGIEAEMN